jgi:hypothetical protein
MPLRRNPDWVPTEHAIQAAFFEWALLHPEAKRAFAVPNGGLRSKAVAGKLKAEGVRSGVPDVCLPKARGGYHGLFIEFKSASGRLTDAQHQELALLEADGYAVAVCRSTEAAVELVAAYLEGKVTRPASA